MEHLKNLESLNIYQDSIVIFDRGYYSENFFRYCVEHGHLCLMRLKEGYNLAKKCSGDVLTFLPGNSRDGTADIDVRVIEVTLDDGTKEYLATNLFDPLITQAMFQDSLRCRSQIIPGRSFRRKKKQNKGKNSLKCACFCLASFRPDFIQDFFEYALLVYR